MQVSKETYYTLPGVCEDGSREVLGVVDHPTEGAVCWQQELEALKEGVSGKQTSLFLTPCKGIGECRVCGLSLCFSPILCGTPEASGVNSVSNKDKATVMKDLSEVFPMEDNAVDSLWGYEHFISFVAK